MRQAGLFGLSEHLKRLSAHGLQFRLDVGGAWDRRTASIGSPPRTWPSAREHQSRSPAAALGALRRAVAQNRFNLE
jgi:hypothetical protein